MPGFVLDLTSGTLPSQQGTPGPNSDPGSVCACLCVMRAIWGLLHWLREPDFLSVPLVKASPGTHTPSWLLQTERSGSFQLSFGDFVITG